MNGKQVITYPCQSLCHTPLRGMVATAKEQATSTARAHKRPGSSKQKVI